MISERLVSGRCLWKTKINLVIGIKWRELRLYFTVYQKTNTIYAKPKVWGLLLNIWFGRCLVIGTVLTQKCGDDLCTIDGNTASITVDRILIISLKLKNRDGIKKQGDRNPSRMVMIGRYSKGTDGQIYTSSSICKYILLVNEQNSLIIKILFDLLIEKNKQKCV